MKTSHAILAGVLLTLAVFIYGLILAPSLPPLIPTHWNIYGQIDGWGNKQNVLVLMPGVMGLLLLLLLALPWLSPHNFSVENFRDAFNYLMLIAIALMGYMHIIMLQAALHPDINSAKGLLIGLFLFFALMGNMLGKVRRNFWIGIRTPWTLASDQVWIATHRLAARLMVAGGIGGALAAWLGAPFSLCFIFLMLTILIPVPYSLLRYKQMEPEK